MAPYKRPNSKYWWMKFTFDGELIQQSTKVSNKRDALAIEAAFRHELALGRIGITPKKAAPSFVRAIEDYLAWSKIEHSQKPNSFVRIEFSCKPLKEFFGEKKVDRIEPKDVEKFVIWRSGQISKKTKQPISRDTVSFELITLKSVFKRLVLAGTLASSPASGIKQLAENDRNFHVLTDDEEKIYLMACPQPLQDVAVLILETGMRPAEIYHLKRENVAIEKGFLQVVGGKTKSSNRKVWLSDKALKVLRIRLDRFKGEYLFPKSEVDGADATHQLNPQHRETLKRVGFKFRLYDCRHTFATRALDGGIDLLTLASMLGHVNLDQVTRYAHPSETRKNDAMKQMQKRAAKAV
jgi:integrase